jgi:hypothetical protein
MKPSTKTGLLNWTTGMCVVDEWPSYDAGFKSLFLLCPPLLLLSVLNTEVRVVLLKYKLDLIYPKCPKGFHLTHKL